MLICSTLVIGVISEEICCHVVQWPNLLYSYKVYHKIQVIYNKTCTVTHQSKSLTELSMYYPSCYIRQSHLCCSLSTLTMEKKLWTYLSPTSTTNLRVFMLLKSFSTNGPIHFSKQPIATRRHSNP